MSSLLLFLFAVGAGYLVFRIILKLLPQLERRELRSQKKEVFLEAQRQRSNILTDQRHQAEEHIKFTQEEFEAELIQDKEDNEARETEVEAQEQQLEEESKRIDQLEQSLSTQKEEAEKSDVLKEKQDMYASHFQELHRTLAKQAEVVVEKVVADMTQQEIEDRQLDCQKVLKSLHEELSASARKRAQQNLERIHARYQPTFVWPRSNTIIELDQQQLEKVMEAETTWLEELHEVSEVSIKIQTNNRILRFGGGFGIHREAALHSLRHALSHPDLWRREEIMAEFKRCSAELEREALALGHKAVTELELKGVHKEIQRLVGSLNWRTSYRQNQWHHTVEVARLAGMLATELGVDPDAAKRVGLLHDIGKAIDYKIDAGHAIISGDYADRFGESRYICDVVMSHHADLLVETPLAYLLRAADTLSGARPGARVNIEEGYQIRLEAIWDAVQSFPGVDDIAIMNGGREVHVRASHRKVAEKELAGLAGAIASKIEEEVSYPGKIKVLVSRTFESSAVA